MQDTIALEPDTLEVDAGPSDEVEIPAEDVSEETEAEAPVETGSAYEDEESAAKDPVVAALIKKQVEWAEARVNKSVEDRLANEREKAIQQQQAQTYAAMQTEASQWRQAQSNQELFGLIQKTIAYANEGKSAEEIWQSEYRNITGVSAKIDLAAVAQAFEAVRPIANDALLSVFPDYKAPTQLAEKFFGAVHRLDMRATLRAVMEIAKDAAEKDPRITAKATEEAKKRVEGERKVTSAQTAAANRQGRSPTLDVPSGGSRRTMTLAQIDAMPTNEWLSMPKAERDRLLEEAHRRAS